MDFIDKIIQKQLLGLADRRRGRFRSFLVKSLENFVRDRIESEMAAKRGGGRVLPLDERRDVPAVAGSPDALAGERRDALDTPLHRRGDRALRANQRRSFVAAVVVVAQRAGG